MAASDDVYRNRFSGVQWGGPRNPTASWGGGNGGRRSGEGNWNNASDQSSQATQQDPGPPQDGVLPPYQYSTGPTVANGVATGGGLPPGTFPVTPPAPTSAQTAANPAQYAGTSFDPNRGVTPFAMQPPSALADNSGDASSFREYNGQQIWAPGGYYTSADVPQQKAPPAGSFQAPGSTDQFITPTGNTWTTPGMGSPATSADYDAMMAKAWGPDRFNPNFVPNVLSRQLAANPGSVNPGNFNDWLARINKQDSSGTY
jgi:hypothetical protein